MTWQEHIKPALEYQNTHLIEDVERMIENGEAMLWLGENSAAVTEIIRYPRAKSLHLWLCGGDMNEITEQMLPQAEAFARAEGCTKMTTGGRKGWDRVMSKHGFTPVASICAKELL
jgi:hypothetical protein